MVRKLAMSAALMAAGPAGAGEVQGIQNHAAQSIYFEEPCTAVVSIIDSPGPDSDTIESATDWAAMTGMVWGTLLGFELAHPGIRGDHQTNLRRLRTDCAAKPDRTALELLRGYAAEVGTDD